MGTGTRIISVVHQRASALAVRYIGYTIQFMIVAGRTQFEDSLNELDLKQTKIGKRIAHDTELLSTGRASMNLNCRSFANLQVVPRIHMAT